MDTESREKEIQQAILLEKINKKLLQLGSTSRWKKVPELLPGSESLKQKVLVMVDDSTDVLWGFAPYLVAATDGSASFVHFRDQPLTDLLPEILASNPDIILLDNDLSDDLQGPELTRALKQFGFKGAIVGFSSEKRSARDFQNSGAVGFVEKEPGNPEQSIKTLVDLIANK